MRRMTCAAVLALLAWGMSWTGQLVLAQDVPALSVVPTKATMLIGETRTFRAVGKDGRLRHDVRWTVSPEQAAKLTVAGDEATLQAEEPSSTVVLTASAEGDSSEASIEIRSGSSLPTGTIMWSVSPLPGCKSMKMTQAVPTATGPDIYDEESCPDGTYVRALTADGRELWRRKLGGAPVPTAPDLERKEKSLPTEHIGLSTRSVCDEISSGMTKMAFQSSRRTATFDWARKSGKVIAGCSKSTTSVARSGLAKPEPW
ncbi:MAG: hypothetical protein WA254_11480 [Candidatus Sulfotelmatobacter sp.]